VPVPRLYDMAMTYLAEAPIWWYWIGVALLIPSILFILALIALYLYKVVRPQYQKR